MSRGQVAVLDRSERVERTGWFRWTARAGLAGRGVIYVLFSYFALEIALHGSSPAPASSEGAIEEVARQPAGPALLSILVVTLGAYGLWRLVEAVSGREKPGKPRNGFVRIGWLAIAGVYIFLCVRAIDLLTAGSSGGGSGQARAWASRVFSWPAGPELLGLVGAGLVAAAVALAAWGFFHHYEKNLRLEGLGPAGRRAPKVLGAIGETARGVVVALVGVYLLSAAVGEDPSRVKTTDLALRSFVHEPFGTVIVGALSAGLLGFAVYSFAEAWLRDL